MAITEWAATARPRHGRAAQRSRGQPTDQPRAPGRQLRDGGRPGQRNRRTRKLHLRCQRSGGQLAEARGQSRAP
eukprot:15470787-Alexandrium_andersonii.AAC.1